MYKKVCNEATRQSHRTSSQGGRFATLPTESPVAMVGRPYRL